VSGAEEGEKKKSKKENFYVVKKRDLRDQAGVRERKKGGKHRWGRNGGGGGRVQRAERKVSLRDRRGMNT